MSLIVRILARCHHLRIQLMPLQRPVSVLLLGLLLCGQVLSGAAILCSEGNGSLITEWLWEECCGDTQPPEQDDCVDCLDLAIGAVAPITAPDTDEVASPPVAGPAFLIPAMWEGTTAVRRAGLRSAPPCDRVVQHVAASVVLTC